MPNRHLAARRISRDGWIGLRRPISRDASLSLLLAGGAAAVMAVFVALPLLLGTTGAGLAVALGAGFAWAAVAWRRGWPVVVPLISIGWGLCVFTTEAGVSVGQSSDSFGASKLGPIFLMGVGVALLLASQRKRVSIAHPAVTVAFSGYLLWQFVSLLGSSYPLLSSLRVAQAVVPFAVVVIMARRAISPLWLIYPTLLACFAHVVYALTSGTYVGFVGEQRLVGLLIADSFALAAGLAIVISVALWQCALLPRGLRWVPVPIIALSGLAISESVGRTASIAVPIAIVLGCVVFGGRRRSTGTSGSRRVVLALATIAGAVYVLRNISSLGDWFSTGNNSLDTLSGRTTLWRLIVGAVDESPVVGYGPGSMRFEVPDLRGPLGQLLDLGQAHNSLFEALVNSGYVGAGLWLGAMLSVIYASFRVNTRFRPLTASLAIALAISSITLGNMSGFGIGWYTLMALVGVVSASDRTEAMAVGRNDTRLAPRRSGEYGRRFDSRRRPAYPVGQEPSKREVARVSLHRL